MKDSDLMELRMLIYWNSVFILIDLRWTGEQEVDKPATLYPIFYFDSPV